MSMSMTQVSIVSTPPAPAAGARSWFRVGPEESKVRARCEEKILALQLEQGTKEQTDPVQLPAEIYTKCGHVRWNAILEFAEDRYGQGYVYRQGQRVHATYYIRITTVYDTRAQKPIEKDELPAEARYLLGWVIAFPTTACNLIKGQGVKSTESGWEAWRLAMNDKPLRVQKKCLDKRGGFVKYLGGGFLNPKTRTEDQRAYYCKQHGLATSTMDLPPLTDTELLQYWDKHCDEKGSSTAPDRKRPLRKLKARRERKRLVPDPVKPAVDKEPATSEGGSRVGVAMKSERTESEQRGPPRPRRKRQQVAPASVIQQDELGADADDDDDNDGDDAWHQASSKKRKRPQRRCTRAL